MPEGQTPDNRQQFSESAIALTFDDVLIRPGASNVLPNEVDVSSRVTRSISLHIPVMSSAMDTVTEARLAIAMAQAGGIGVIHRNLDPEVQAAQVAQVKKFESGMVVNPVTITPDKKLADARKLMTEHKIRQLPVINDSELVGIITDRDIRSFLSGSLLSAPEAREKALNAKVRDVMTTEPLTMAPDDDLQEAVELLIEEKIGGIPVVDESEGLVGIVTYVDVLRCFLNRLQEE